MPPENQNPVPPQQPNVPGPSTPPPSPAPSFPSQTPGSPQVVGPQHASGQPLFAPDTPSTTSKRKRRLPKILLVVVLVLVLIGSGGSYAYWNMLNNRPEKVLADALGNSMSDILDRKPTSFVSKLVYESKGDEPYKVTLDVDGKYAKGDFETAFTLRVQGNFDDEELDISFKTKTIIMDAKELYIRFDDIEQSLEDAAIADPEAQVWADAIRPIVQKIDGQWLKIDSESLAEAGLTESEHELNACSDAVDTLRIKSEDKAKIKDIFSRNQFAIATEKLPKEKASDEESFHYKLDLNERAGIKFTKELVELPSFATVKKDCDIDQKDLDRDLKEFEDQEKEHADGHQENEDQHEPVIELWVGAETRLPTRLKVAFDDKELTTVFDSTVKINARNINITAPTDTMSFNEIMQEIQTLNLNY